MLTPRSKRRLAFSLLATTTLASGLLGGSSANADPKQYGAAVGVGSDTTQDVMNAMAGFTNGIAYTPVNSGSGSSFRQLTSFDASPPAGVSDTCITTKLNGPTFTRPNGSGAGAKALSASAGGNPGGWKGAGVNPTCATLVDISGQIDYSRSSSGPTAGDSGTSLTYIPFGRDGVSFGYYRAAGSPVTTLTRADLQALFQTGPQVIGGVRIVPCGIQTGSGTFSFWNSVTGANTTQENTATTECNALLGRAQENDGTDLKARGDALAALAGHSGDQVVIGFSAGAFVAKSNLVAPGAPPAGVGIGSISDNGSGVNLGSPVTGTAPTLAASSTFYSDTVFGRNIYNVLTTTVATGPGNASMKALFVGSTSAVCSNTAVISAFGFLPIGASCGSTTLKGSFRTGAS